MASLYEVTGEYKAVMEMAEDGETDPQVITDTLESIAGEIEVKADGYAKIIKMLDIQAKGIKSEEERLANMRKSLENNIARMKKSLETSMIETGNKKFKTPLFSFNIQKNPPNLVIDDFDNIPDKFLIQQPPKIDNKLLKDFIKDNPVPFAHLEQGESLRIR